MENYKDHQSTAGKDDAPAVAETEQKYGRDMAEWEQMDAKISGHPFLRKYTLAERKALQNQAKGAVADPIYQKQRQQFVNFLTEILKVTPLILMDIYKDQSVYAEEVGESYVNSGFFRWVVNVDEQFLPKREKLRAYFDGYAYMEAVSRSISCYDETYVHPKTKRPASFLGLFAAEYKNCLNKVRLASINRGFHIPKSYQSKINQILRFLGQYYPGYRSQNLPEEVYQTIAAVCGLPEKTTRRLVNLIRDCNTISLDAPAGDSETPLLENLPAPDTAAERMDVTNETEIYAVIEAISGLELKEYLQLLMNNLLLYPIHQEVYPPADKNISLKDEDLDYKDSLRQNQERLKQNVWDFDYLSFVAWKDAEGKDGNAEDIEVLCNYYPLHPLLNQTIAEHKKCTPANITYYSKKFAEIRKQVAEMVRGNW